LYVKGDFEVLDVLAVFRQALKIDIRNKFLPKLFLYRVCSKPRLFCLTCVKFLKFPLYQLTSLIGRETGYLDTAGSGQQKFNLFLLKFPLLLANYL